MSEIMTVAEVASLLRLSRSQVYELTKPRQRSGDLRDNPLPALRMGAAVRFRKYDVDAWVERMSNVK